MKTIFALVGITLCMLIFSCKKQQPACTGNCSAIIISGKAIIKTTGIGRPNIPVEVSWFRKGYCIGCTTYKVASGKTGSDGSFRFSTTIDTSYFKDYILNVQVPNDTNFIGLPYSAGQPEVQQNFYSIDLTAMQNIRFDFFPKTLLTIKLHRTLADNYTYFFVGHSFTNEINYSDFQSTAPSTPGYQTLPEETAAGIYTKISWRKDVGGVSTTKVDSLICTVGGSNVFNINY